MFKSSILSLGVLVCIMVTNTLSQGQEDEKLKKQVEELVNRLSVEDKQTIRKAKMGLIELGEPALKYIKELSERLNNDNINNIVEDVVARIENLYVNIECINEGTVRGGGKEEQYNFNKKQRLSQEDLAEVILSNNKEKRAKFLSGFIENAKIDGDIIFNASRIVWNIRRGNSSTTYDISGTLTINKKLDNGDVLELSAELKGFAVVNMTNRQGEPQETTAKLDIYADVDAKKSVKDGDKIIELKGAGTLEFGIDEFGD